MGKLEQKNILTGLTVREAMRRQVICLPQTASLDRCIARFIKYKVNALLLTDDADRPSGVISKTDVMGAYYAGMPVETFAEDIMISPPLFCKADDFLETALEIMRENGVYRIYVEDENGRAEGVIAYPDIVGILYKFCHECKYSRLKRKKGKEPDALLRFTVKEVMTPSIQSYKTTDSLTDVMEGLSAYRLGAVLITDDAGKPAGVVSKTDLTTAYRHGVDSMEKAGSIMSSPVRTCHKDEFLEEAVRTLIFAQVHRIFVHDTDINDIVGVLSLSDAARVRSGSCQACVSSRIRVEDHE